MAAGRGVVGFLNAYELTGRDHFLNAAERSWAFIEKSIVDHEFGEWFWLVSRSGAPNANKDKVGPWKCPYHNSRTCFEVMERLEAKTHSKIDSNLRVRKAKIETTG